MGLTVSDEEIRALDAKMRELNDDVLAHPVPPPPPGAFISEFSAFKSEWTVFFLHWLQWAGEHRTFLSQTGDQVAAEFDGWQGGYNEQRRRFLENFGGTTAAEESASGGPLDDAADAVKHAGTDLMEVALILGGLYVIGRAIGGGR